MNRTQEQDHHARVDPHKVGARVPEIILGGQDGLVNTLGVVLGIAAASASTRIVLAGGLAAALAEAVSMAAVAYTSGVAAGHVYESERAREYRHIERAPNLEREEIRAIYARKGFSGEMLERIVATITENRDVWVAVMLAEEHGLSPVTRPAALRSAAAVGASALLGSLVPIVPFFVLGLRPGGVASVAATAAALFALGAYKGRVTVGRWVLAGLELAGVGLVSALVGYLVGWLVAAS